MAAVTTDIESIEHLSTSSFKKHPDITVRSEMFLSKCHSANVRHYLISRSDLRIFSNQYSFQILRSMADLLVRVRVRIRAYVSDIIGCRFEKVRNGHRFENWMTSWEFEKGHRFENWMQIWEFEKRT
jgi:hypothetical protein